MPAYSKFISPKGNEIPAKLSSEEIEKLASYVREQADLNWPKSNLENTMKNCDEYPGC